jgi:hypothetical protein
MTKRSAKRLRIVALIILLPMVMATLGQLLNLPMALRALQAGPQPAVEIGK